MEEKNSTAKKGFLAKMKSGFTGIICTGYDKEYNFVTMNGTREIPNNLQVEREAFILMEEQMLDELASYTKEIENLYKAIEIKETTEFSYIEFGEYIPHKDLTKKEAVDILDIDEEVSKNI